MLCVCVCVCLCVCVCMCLKREIIALKTTTDTSIPILQTPPTDSTHSQFDQVNVSSPASSDAPPTSALQLFTLISQTREIFTRSCFSQRLSERRCVALNGYNHNDLVPFERLHGCSSATRCSALATVAMFT